jgi:hypothetical protein
VRALLSEGIALAKLHAHSPLRAVLETNNSRLTDPSHLGKLIPLVLEKELATILSEITNVGGTPTIYQLACRALGVDMGSECTMDTLPISITFDASTTVCEVFAILLRFITPDFYVQHRLIRFDHLDSSMDAGNVAFSIMSALLHGGPWHLKPDTLKAMMADRASVNISAMSSLESTFRGAERLGCLSHTISNAGKKLENTHSKITFDFVSKWINIIGRSAHARAVFRELAGVAPLRANLTRWYDLTLRL